MPHLGNERSQLGTLSRNCGVDIADTVTFLSQQLSNMSQQFEAADTFVPRVGVGEMLSNVAEGSGTEQSIANGMQKHIGIAVTNKAMSMRHLHTTKP